MEVVTFFSVKKLSTLGLCRQKVCYQFSIRSRVPYRCRIKREQWNHWRWDRGNNYSTWCKRQTGNMRRCSSARLSRRWRRTTEYLILSFQKSLRHLFKEVELCFSDRAGPWVSISTSVSSLLQKYLYGRSPGSPMFCFHGSPGELCVPVQCGEETLKFRKTTNVQRPLPSTPSVLCVLRVRCRFGDLS